MLLNSISFKTAGLMPSFKSNPIKNSPKIIRENRFDAVELKDYPYIMDSPTLDRNAKKLHDKMLAQTYAVDKNSIESTINNVQLLTGVSKEDVQQALIKLTQFSSYSQLDSLSRAMSEQKITSVRILKEIAPDSKEFSLGSVLTYLQKYKEQFEFSNDTIGSQGLFLDNMLLDKLEEIKDTPTGQKFIQTIKDELQSGQTKLVAIDGWNTKINGKDVSHGLFGSNTSLEVSLLLILEKAKKNNLSIDEVLNKDTIQRAKALFGDDAEVNIIKNSNVSDFSTQNIVKTMAPNLPSENDIKAVKNLLIEKSGYNSNEMEKLCAIHTLSKYFDHMLTCYSSETLTKELQKKYQDIKEFALSKGKTMDDVYYIIPSENKSFDLINYQYLKANNVSPDKVIHCDGTEETIETLEECDNKIVVLLDDIVGSGNSMINQEFNYHSFAQLCEERYLDINFVFAPLVSLQSGIENLGYAIEDDYRTEEDTIIVNNTIDYGDFVQSLSVPEQRMLQKLIGNIGFCIGGACTSMPYMIPDNSSEASGYFLQKTINNGNSPKANKPIIKIGTDNWNAFQKDFNWKSKAYEKQSLKYKK